MSHIYLHCRLLPGGASQVLKDLILDDIQLSGEEIERSILTLISRNKTFVVVDQYHVRHELAIHTVLPRRVCDFFLWVQDRQIPILKFFFDYRNLIVFAPLLMRLMSKQLQALCPKSVTVSSFALVKNVALPTGIQSKLYLHSPMQYIHSHVDEYMAKITGLKGWIFAKVVNRLQRWDTKLRPGYDVMYANSQYTADGAMNLYSWECQVLYPRVHVGATQSGRIAGMDLLKQYDLEGCPYYIYVGRLVKFVKEVDLLICLSNELGFHLLLLGSGPDEMILREMAGPTVHFLGWIDDVATKSFLVQQSSGLLNITKESFGISTMEAILLEVPVFGFADGASVELIDQHNGFLVTDKNHTTLVAGFHEFQSKFVLPAGTK